MSQQRYRLNNTATNSNQTTFIRNDAAGRFHLKAPNQQQRTAVHITTVDASIRRNNKGASNIHNQKAHTAEFFFRLEGTSAATGTDPAPSTSPAA
jgi:hypothetical protein